MKNYLDLGRALKSRAGFSESIEFLGVMAILLIVFYILMMAFPPFMAKANVENLTNSLVRQIEIHGAIDDEIGQYAAELADAYGLSPEITYDADFIEGTHHIQIRDGFKVAVSQEEKIVLLDSTFFDPLEVTIPIRNEKAGISEKLWK